MLLRHVISLLHVPCRSSSCFSAWTGTWESLLGPPLILSTYTLQPLSLRFSVLSCGRVAKPGTDLFSFQSGETKILFNVLHSDSPLGFPKSLSFWNKEQNYFKLYLFSPLLHPSLKAMKPETAWREKRKGPYREIYISKCYLAIGFICM